MLKGSFFHNISVFRALEFSDCQLLTFVILTLKLYTPQMIYLRKKYSTRSFSPKVLVLVFKGPSIRGVVYNWVIKGNIGLMKRGLRTLARGGRDNFSFINPSPPRVFSLFLLLLESSHAGMRALAHPHILIAVQLTNRWWEAQSWVVSRP